MPGEADDYLYAAISQTRFVFAKVEHEFFF